ncbi:MAG: CDP-6-deoxy-delta-3,4-glucoseen reductase [Proteobacteria bacterium]|nr:CDP-6-deoxy-delta-3,4-glucoseen reductase [Pseudomonadota bacterium]
MHTLTLSPGGQTFQAEDNETVLAAALRSGLVIPYGCKNGACGSCKGTVVSGTVDYGKYQEKALPATEREQGKALFCQARPLSDCTLEARVVGKAGDIQVKTLPCRVHSLQKLTDDVIVLQLKLPASEKLQFLAGQYLEFLLRDGTRRSFSMGNAPHDAELVEIHVRHVPGGQFTDHDFGKMKEKNILRFEAPLGTFLLREPSDGRRPKDLYMHELAQKWAAEYGAFFDYVPVIPDAQPEDGWTGRTGFVHSAVMEDLPDLSGYQVYACGVPIMVDSAKKDLIEKCKLPEDEFYADSFTTAADLAGT